jgi:hypothetical protein
MPQLPEGTLGDAVGVLIFTFICLFTNMLLLWLYWITNERLSCGFLFSHFLILNTHPLIWWELWTDGYWYIDIALVGYFALLCTASSIIQQIYNYS